MTLKFVAVLPSAQRKGRRQPGLKQPDFASNSKLQQLQPARANRSGSRHINVELGNKTHEASKGFKPKSKVRTRNVVLAFAVAGVPVTHAMDAGFEGAATQHGQTLGVDGPDSKQARQEWGAKGAE